MKNEQIQSARFACKARDVNEIFFVRSKQVDRFKIVETIVMGEQEMEAFAYNLLDDREFLKGKGGTSSTTFPETAKDRTDYFEFTEQEAAEFNRGAYRECVGIETPAGKLMFAVDPQGYNYARYIAVF